MRLRVKILILVALLVVVGLLLNYLARSKGSSRVTLPSATPLGPKETTRITFEGDNLVTLTHKDISTRYIPPEGNVSVTVDDKGKVEEAYDSHGFTTEIGPGLVYADRLRLALDVEFYYWNRLGVNVGVGIAPSGLVLVPYLALSYQLDQLHMDNTSLLVGYTTHKDVLFGIRVAF